MNHREPLPCELLTWDSEFFGRRIGRVCGQHLDPALAEGVDAWSRQNRAEALYFLAASDDPQTIRTAQASGFELVDIRLTLCWSPPASSARPTGSSEKRSELRIRDFESPDLPKLRRVARESHRDTRFFSDPHFERRRAEDLYDTWISLECQGRAAKVLVATSPTAQPVGYISCHRGPHPSPLPEGEGERGQIGLVGVDATVRGQGVGRLLVEAALDWFVAQGLQQVRVVTQGKNLAAQRLYQRCGFLTEQVQLWYHKWYEAAPSRSAGPVQTPESSA